MKRLFIFLAVFLCISLLLSRFVICKMRWTDARAIRQFGKRNIPFSVHDTLIKGHNLHYAVAGSSDLPSLVFIHGSPGSWFHYKKYMWDEDLLKKYRMIGIDRPGFGFSDYGEPMHLQDQCRLILPLLQRLKTGQPMFIFGHSYGGPLVVRLSAEDTSLFSTVIIASGALDVAEEKKESWRHLMENKPMTWFLPGVFRQSNTELLYLKKDLVSLQNDFVKLRSHVVLIHGTKDEWVPFENMAYGRKMFRNAVSVRCDTLVDANHNFPWNRREVLKKTLMELY
jgi:pimeloyl-ACP methyl ester carboxylesterase